MGSLRTSTVTREVHAVLPGNAAETAIGCQQQTSNSEAAEPLTGSGPGTVAAPMSAT